MKWFMIDDCLVFMVIILLSIMLIFVLVFWKEFVSFVKVLI